MQADPWLLWHDDTPLDSRGVRQIAPAESLALLLPSQFLSAFVLLSSFLSSYILKAMNFSQGFIFFPPHWKATWAWTVPSWTVELLINWQRSANVRLSHLSIMRNCQNRSEYLSDTNWSANFLTMWKISMAKTSFLLQKCTSPWNSVKEFN